MYTTVVMVAAETRNTYSVPEWYVNYVIWTHKASLNYEAEQLDFDQQKRV